MVLQEEQHQAYSFSGAAPVSFVAAAAGASAGEEVGENRPNKKPKQKKTPQRGLGVAQLEKIRLEEQQKGTAATSAPSLHSSFSPVMPLPSLPPSSTSFSGVSELNPATRPTIPIPSAPFCDLSVLVPPPLPPAVDGPMVAPPASLAGQGLLPLLWNPLETTPRDVNASKKTFSFSIPLQDESADSIWQNPGPVHRHQQPQHQTKNLLPNSSVSPSFLPSLPGVKLRMEPPSNQTILSKPAIGDEKMAGMKRPWPFHLDTMPGYTSFPCKLPLPPSSFSLADEYPPMNGHDLPEFKPGSTIPRDGPLSSGTFQVDWRNLYAHLPAKKYKEGSSAPVRCDSLTLGSSLSPRAPAAPSKSKQPTGTLLSQCYETSSVSTPVPYHGNTDGAIWRFGGSSQSPDRLPFYSFLPMRSSSQENGLEEQRHETVGSLDLNLKL